MVMVVVVAGEEGREGKGGDWFAASRLPNRPTDRQTNRPIASPTECTYLVTEGRGSADGLTAERLITLFRIFQRVLGQTTSQAASLAR